MKKSLLVLSSILALSLLPSCASNQPSNSSSIETSEVSIPAEKSPISLYSATSRYVFGSYSDDKSALLPTYHHKDRGDVPFIELHDFINALTKEGQLSASKVTPIADHLYALSSNNLIVMLIDTLEKTITVKNMDAYEPYHDGQNNGVGNDICGHKDEPSSCVHSSYLSDYVGTIEDEVYDLKKFSLELEEDNGNIYLPLSVITSLLLRGATYDVIYNGLDFYSTMYMGEGYFTAFPGNYSSCYANKNEFAFAKEKYRKVDPVGDEVYRFVHDEVDNEGNASVSMFCFLQDGSVIIKKGEDASSSGETLEAPYVFTYSEDEEHNIFLKEEIPTLPGYGGTIKIPAKDSYYSSLTRSKETAEFTLDLLNYQFESFYGLKKELFARYQVSSINELIEKKDLKQRLLSTSSLDYDEALCEFLLTYIDDGHTKYKSRSIYSGLPEDYDVGSLASEKEGERRRGLFVKKENYMAARTAAMTEIDPIYEDSDKQQGLFIEGNTAVIRFDAFNMSTAIIENVVEKPLENLDISETMKTSTPDSFYLSFEEIKKHDEVENVVIDLTCNGGGASPTLPYLAAHWTYDPTFVIKDMCMNVVKEFHYSVDLNRNGIFGEEEDSYQNDYDFFILTSDFSFSCGNGLPCMGKADGVTIIGKRSGGGACPVQSYNDGSGTIYNTSMPFQIVYKNENGDYVNNDGGVPVDYELDENVWYDLPSLSAFVNSLRQ